MTWFDELTGFREASPDQVRSQLRVDGDCIVRLDGKRMAFGMLETPTLEELRQRVDQVRRPTGKLRLSEVVANARDLHANSANAHAMFQVASQFNLLEMASPSVTPERGVGIYERDWTQGPACAISCGAAAIYRNYFAIVGNETGQSANHQIDCAADLGLRLGNREGSLWTMENGYMLPTDWGLNEITRQLQAADECQLDRYRGSLRIGLQWNAAVTLPGAGHRVSQALCSALPVAYGRQEAAEWADFARLILEAAYEATFCAGILNAEHYGCSRLFLTLLGGGAFGNPEQWIVDALERACQKHHDSGLDVVIVSHGSSKPLVANLVRQIGTAF
ncbi:hypothetical protein [Novipirellula artificiosorum]|uniref:Uncharacterized protein n=1 Tax=Novipirellula artificiosorum TaxID=2528016 RepID=A0A5C6E2M0_9BACT|nr:hypothetical protein [Novipirellula artificiosorum]TWU42217.1 hypothetical protein Poly41_05130 [Novipirellula artificiosorum]